MNVFQFNSKNATQTVLFACCQFEEIVICIIVFILESSNICCLQIVHIIDGTNPNLVVLLPFTTTKSFQLPSPRTRTPFCLTKQMKSMCLLIEI